MLLFFCHGALPQTWLNIQVGFQLENADALKIPQRSQHLCRSLRLSLSCSETHWPKCQWTHRNFIWTAVRRAQSQKNNKKIKHDSSTETVPTFLPVTSSGVKSDQMSFMCLQVMFCTYREGLLSGRAGAKRPRLTYDTMSYKGQSNSDRVKYQFRRQLHSLKCSTPLTEWMRWYVKHPDDLLGLYDSKQWRPLGSLMNKILMCPWQ